MWNNGLLNAPTKAQTLILLVLVTLLFYQGWDAGDQKVLIHDKNCLRGSKEENELSAWPLYKGSKWNHWDFWQSNSLLVSNKIWQSSIKTWHSVQLNDICLSLINSKKWYIQSQEKISPTSEKKSWRKPVPSEGWSKLRDNREYSSCQWLFQKQELSFSYIPAANFKGQQGDRGSERE